VLDNFTQREIDEDDPEGHYTETREAVKLLGVKGTVLGFNAFMVWDELVDMLGADYLQRIRDMNAEQRHKLKLELFE
jgi:hypothetical protein